MSGGEGARAGIGALVAHAQRLPSLVHVLGEATQRRVEDHRASRRAAIAGVDVGGDLLQVQKRPRVEFRQPRELLPQPSRRFFRSLMRVARGRRVPIQVIDDAGVEGRLPLQIGSDGSPDETGETSSPSGLGRRRGGRDIPRAIDRRELGVVSDRVGRGPLPGLGHAAIERGQRVVVTPVGLVAFLVEALQRLFE